ncbi:uncharacterized protein METZ01_LOCUS357224, partial [marine metagenome]
MKKTNELTSAIGPNGKQITAMLVRPPKTRSDTKFPSRLAAVHDSRANPIRGLWFRLPHGPWVAQFTTPAGPTKVKLDANTLAQAKAEHQRLKVQSREGTLPSLGRAPGFSDYANS